MRTCFVITSLEVGGAEQMLLKVLEQLKNKISCEVISLKGSGPLASKVIELGIPLTELSLNKWPRIPFELLKLYRHFKRSRPDNIQTWLYHGDLFGGVIGRAAGGRVFWNVRSHRLHESWSNLPALLLVRLLISLSRLVPDKIVFCSKKGLEHHVRLGYPAARSVWIPNGFDTAKFVPNPQARDEVRKTFGIKPNELVIGSVGRLDPLKDYPTFFRAAALCHLQGLKARYVLVGKDLTATNPLVGGWLKTLPQDLQERFLLLGQQSQIHSLMNSIDIFALTSRHEGFPNVLGEAMACAIPCVSTDAGDALEIMGDCGIGCDVGDAQAIADAWLKLSSDPDLRKQLGESGRKRILETYDIRHVADQYLNLYLKPDVVAETPLLENSHVRN